ncbi:hypothetical protein AAMO2058_001702800, partial [Amorphochlora amoebiformis]
MFVLYAGSILYGFCLSVTVLYLHRYEVSIASFSSYTMTAAGVMVLASKGLANLRMAGSAMRVVLVNSILLTAATVLHLYALKHCGLFRYSVCMLAELWVGKLAAVVRALSKGDLVNMRTRMIATLPAGLCYILLMNTDNISRLLEADTIPYDHQSNPGMGVVAAVAACYVDRILKNRRFNSKAKRRAPAKGLTEGLSFLTGGILLGFLTNAYEMVSRMNTSEEEDNIKLPTPHLTWIQWVFMVLFVSEFVLILKSRLVSLFHKLTYSPRLNPSAKSNSISSKTSQAIDGDRPDWVILMVLLLKLFFSSVFAYMKTGNTLGMMESLVSVLVIVTTSQDIVKNRFSGGIRMNEIGGTCLPMYVQDVIRTNKKDDAKKSMGIWIPDMYGLRRLWHHIHQNKKSSRLFWFLGVNIMFMCLELFYGLWTNSLGLISDAGHMMMDCMALGIG